jgi:hypothetical protein
MSTLETSRVVEIFTASFNAEKAVSEIVPTTCETSDKYFE